MHGHQKKPTLTKFYSLFKLTALCALFAEHVEASYASYDMFDDWASDRWQPPFLTTGVNRWGGCGAGGCDRCEGDCDSDNDCKAGSRCFQRDGLESVPGCSGDGVSGMDYCFAPPLTTGDNWWFGCCPFPPCPGGCNLCEGDCHTDSECKAGLHCFHRDGLESVPGCSGDGKRGTDYCIPPPPPLTTGVNHRCGAGGCNLCEGDCQTDSECKAGLRCFHRDGLESVPGCSGDGVYTMNYCILPPPLTRPGIGVNWRHGGRCAAGDFDFDFARGCSLCEGDCASDSDCKAGLRCFQRDRWERVPGCTGDGESGMDYCISPPLTTGVNRWGGCGAGGCSLCEGDCDTDSDCTAGLRCFHRGESRDALASVPGCSGDGESHMDYCISSVG